MHEVSGAMLSLTEMNYREPSLFNELISIIDQADEIIATNKDWGVYV